VQLVGTDHSNSAVDKGGPLADQAAARIPQYLNTLDDPSRTTAESQMSLPNELKPAAEGDRLSQPDIVPGTHSSVSTAAVEPRNHSSHNGGKVPVRGGRSRGTNHKANQTMHAERSHQIGNDGFQTANKRRGLIAERSIGGPTPGHAHKRGKNQEGTNRPGELLMDKHLHKSSLQKKMG
jgi:hypothetical protein